MEERMLAAALAKKVQEAGGKTYFVGGCVRDRLLGRESKDLDLEVHGVSPRVLEGILDTLGERLEKGKSFGVYGLRHCELDIALPRRERATGAGHRDFAVEVDPFLGERRAAARRDFTVNALMENVLTGEVLDFFGGREDLSRGILRQVTRESFVEDPLRVLRGAQLAARFSFTVAAETRALCRTMNLGALAKERVWEELKKALLRAPQPARFFAELRQMDALSPWFAEVQDLIGVEQPPQYHPEGDVWNHTLGVLDAAAALRGQSEKPLELMLAALCHDFGKVTTTRRVEGRIRALGHEEAGLEPARRLLRRLCGENVRMQPVENLILLHMKPNVLAAQHAGLRATMKLFDRALLPEELLLLAKADRMGQGMPGDYRETEAFLQARLAAYRELLAKPQVTGRDLAGLGLEPGPDYGEALDFAHKLHLAGVLKEAALPQTAAYLRRLRRGAKSP